MKPNVHLQVWALAILFSAAFVLHDTPATRAAEPEPSLPVRILFPGDLSVVKDKRDIEVQVAVYSPPGDPLTPPGVRLTLTPLIHDQPMGPAEFDEIPAASARGPARPDEVVYSLKVQNPQKDFDLAIGAETSDGKFKFKSRPIILRWEGRPAPEVLPALYVLSVGVGRYKAPGNNLTYPAKDARDLVSALQLQKAAVYREVVSMVLTDEAATKANVKAGLSWLATVTTESDVAVMFLAGHGLEGPSASYYFLPHDAAKAQDNNWQSETLISQDDLVSRLGEVRGTALLFLDTCHSGDVQAKSSAPTEDPNTTLVRKVRAAEGGAAVFTASTGAQVSLERADWNNGAFTKSLVEGLRGRAAPWRGEPVTISMLDTYISRRVQQLTGKAQTPMLAMPKITKPDFTVAVAREGLVPVHRRWWFWTALGVATASIAAGIAAGATQHAPAFPAGTMVLTPSWQSYAGALR